MNKDLEPYVSDVTGKIPMFGYPLMTFDEDKKIDWWWKIM